eukprot:6781281-Prymnesium_polylepis.1
MARPRAARGSARIDEEQEGEAEVLDADGVEDLLPTRQQKACRARNARKRQKKHLAAAANQRDADANRDAAAAGTEVDLHMEVTAARAAHERARQLP